MRSATGKALTPMAFVKAIVLAYERYGVRPDEALRKARIAPALLYQPDARVSAAQLEALSNAAMQALDDEALGWFSRKLPWGSYGMLCRASISSPQLGLALQRWCRHHRLLTEDIVLHLDADGAAARLWIEERRDLGEMREICCVTLLRYVHGFACWAIDSRIPLREVHFPFAAPRHRDAYPVMFPGPVRFRMPHAALVFDAAYLALPLRRDERALQAMLQRALPLTVLQYRRDRLLAQRVREALHADTAALADAAAVAAALNVSVRTLHRQLRDEGCSLQQLKDEARRARATELLERSRRPIKQIAAAVGFRNEKSFARAFAGWTGVAPSAWREGVRR